TAAGPATTGTAGPGAPGAPVASTAAAPAPAGGNGGATDVGVTATTVTIGSVSDLTGPQPGLFQTAVNGTNAYLAYVNSQGGLFGRKLKIAVADSQTSCEGDRAGHQGLVEKVFAFAGSFSLFDSCGAAVLKDNPGVPDAHLAVTPEANALPNNFSPNPVGDKINNGIYQWAAKKFGADVVKNTAFMYVSLPAVNNVARLQKRSAESAGFAFTYERAVGATETDFTADVIQMRRAGVKLFLTLFNSDQMSNFKPRADQQDFKPTYLAQLMYDQSFFTKLGGTAAAEGMYGLNGSTLFFSEQDARNEPSVAQFQKWYAKVSGGAAADSFSASAWASTALLVQAMRKAGPQLTGKRVLEELRRTTTFDAEGFYAPSNPAAKKPGNCYVIWQIRGGKYVRTDTPAKGYRCDGVPA
ncbi:MAG: hypothetical protein JWN08_2133, partial [Frankiales bacterium]|nr:hypothetical protein [Frankiales bacterium]